jgi:hypothetical protein
VSHLSNGRYLRGRAIVVTENATDSLLAANGAARSLHGGRFDRLVREALVVPLVIVEVDNPTPTILSREKSVIRGIPGSVAPWPSTTCSSSTSRRSVAAVLKTIRHVGS